ncbi:MAG: hypothetical protein E7523_02290 [Ruminococcaceae bacterium]|nr:hypothetical protein [Oscillospiraceae bacterium]
MLNIVEYKNLLLANDFEEATRVPLHFWKKLTDKTSFVVNLKELQFGVGIVFGVMSTAILWTAEARDYFKQHGCSDDDCNLRFYLEICSHADEITASNTIGELYRNYLHTDKDILLAEVKERRKLFLQQITDVLKPLGFRKKGNRWRKHISEDKEIQFWADKSPYSDLYYFQVDIGGGCCYSERLYTKGTDIFDWKNYTEPDRRFDWQLQSYEDLRAIIRQAYEEKMKPFLENNLTEMGKQPFVWKNCMCSRIKCPNCWVEKNLWEAKNL